MPDQKIAPEHMGQARCSNRGVQPEQLRYRTVYTRADKIALGMTGCIVVGVDGILPFHNDRVVVGNQQRSKGVIPMITRSLCHLDRRAAETTSASLNPLTFASDSFP